VNKRDAAETRFGLPNREENSVILRGLVGCGTCGAL
jgi:hypothetical protein